MTDIEGSTRLFRQLGDSYVEVLETHRDLLGSAFAARGGSEVDTEGDALFVVFADASEAVAGCLEGQLALASHPWPPNGEVRVRIGLHTSETSPVGDRYVDLGVHQVARICAGAHGGQVVMSEETVSAVADRLPPSSSLFAAGQVSTCVVSRNRSGSASFAIPSCARTFRRYEQSEWWFTTCRFSGRASSAEMRRCRDLLSLLRTTGILTLVGLGGVGKTRLAVQLAQQVLDDFPDGAWLVELASLSDPAFVPRAVADAARVAEVPGRDIEEVLVETDGGQGSLVDTRQLRARHRGRCRSRRATLQPLPATRDPGHQQGAARHRG